MLRRLFKPWSVTLLALSVYVGAVLWANGGDPLSLARVGETVCAGYDGQFTYFIALDPTAAAAARLDVPAYRFQRILLPLAARLLAAGDAHYIPWSILVVNMLAQVAGTFIVERLLNGLGVSRWYALIYGLWPGLAAAVRADLTEPLSYALVAGAYLADRQERPRLAALLFGFSLFAKETAVIFVAAQCAFALTARDGPRLWSLLALTIAPFAGWQGLLWAMFGGPGLASGGCLATPFEIIPFMGVWRIAPISGVLFFVFLLFLGPWVIAPSLWGLFAATREALRRNVHPFVWALGANAAVIPFTPFSTFREPVAMLRFITGLVLATLLFGGLVKSRRVLNYSWFWLAMLVFLVKD